MPEIFLCCAISSLGRQDLVTQFLVKITFLYKLVAKKLDFVLAPAMICLFKPSLTLTVLGYFVP